MSWRRPTSVGCTLAIALICTATVSAQETQEDGPPVEPWTLGTLLERAEDVVPTYEMADAGVTEAEYQRLEARLARLPSISVNASLAPVPNVDSDDTFDSEAELFARIFRGVGPYVRAELTASVPIGTFGKIRLHRDLAEVGVDAAEAEAEQVRLETRFRIFQAFLGVQMDARISELIAEADERLTDVRGKLEDALDDGDRGARTSLRQLTIFEAEFTRIRTEAVETGFLARDTLRRALRLQEGFAVEEIELSVPESDVPSLDSVREFAYAQRPDMTLINAAVDAARLRHQIAMREFAPDFYIAGRISRAWAPTIEDQTSPFTYDPYNSFGLGILVGMKLDLHPFRAFAQARQAEARIVEAERQREAARLLVDTDVAQAYQRVVGSHQRLEAYEAAYDAARAWLDQKAFQYDQGFADYEDLEDPLKAYYRAAGDRLQAHYNYRVAVADLATKCGADDLTTVPAASQGSSSDEGANRATGADASEGDGSDTGE